MTTASWQTRPTYQPNKGKSHGYQQWSGRQQFVQYIPVRWADSHSLVVGYLLWLIGFTGAHRFFYGKPLTGILWFFTFGLLGIGWVVDLFLIPSMDAEAVQRFRPGMVDYNLAWLLLVFVGWLGLHRFYQGKIVTGLLYFFTGGLFGIGYVYDVLTLNDQINTQHAEQQFVFEMP